MGILKTFSFSTIAERFGQSFKRFPVAMLLIIFLTGYLMYLNHNGHYKLSGFDMDFFLVFYPATGAVLGVALSLLTEDFKSRIAAFITQVVVHAIWLVVSLYLARFDRFSLPQMITVSATVVAMSLAVFIICFYRRHQDVQFWNFSIRTLMGCIISVIIGGILTLGLFALLESLKMLFNVTIRDTLYGDIAAVCMILLAPTLFMNLIPRDGNKRINQVAEFSGFAKGVVQYLFLPLLGLYMLTLYAYGAMMLIRWSLPVGGVSYLVTGSMVLMILLIYVTYPVQHQEGNKLFKRVTRWLPVVMLPLLALMTVAIWRRLSDYGITLSRLYLLVFNVWCYAVCLWLIFTRNKRIWLIPASFAVILFLISVGPQSIANITQRQLLKEARNAFTSSGITNFPLTADEYDQWLKTADPRVAKAIDSKLEYLNHDFGFESVSPLLDKDVIIGRSSLYEEADGRSVTVVEYGNEELIKNVAVPQGYSVMNWVNEYFDDCKMKDGKLLIEFDEGEMSNKYNFEIEMKLLAKSDKSRNFFGNAEPLIIDNGNALLMIDEYYLSRRRDGTSFFRCSGILFTK